MKSSRGDQIDLRYRFDPYDDDQLWYRIPDFNGYEISNKGMVRSLKFTGRFPFGTIIDPKPSGKYFGMYEMSNNNNTRVMVSRDALWKLAMQNLKDYPYKPVSTCCVNPKSRNNRVFIDYDKAYHTNNALSTPVKPNKEPVFTPKFTVIPD